MALVKCTECGQYISDKASKCPKCGCPVQTVLNNGEVNYDIPSPQRDSNNQKLDTVSKKTKKKPVVIATVICAVIFVVIGFILYFNQVPHGLTVKDIAISKWRLTDSSAYFDYYEGEVTSNEKTPFVAVIGEYNDKDSTPQFVYVENGMGIIETGEAKDEDPSIKYKAIGYMDGKKVNLSDMKIKYTDSNYYDWTYSERTNCNVSIDIDMHNKKTGLLVFDLVNETNNETEQNRVAVIIDGKTKYNYSAELPYKSRGIDVSIVPKLFCESSSVTEKDYKIEKAYTAEKDENEYLKSYLGEEVISFKEYTDGFVLYTKELKEGGIKENRNVVEYSYSYFQGGECTLSTYDWVSEGENILMPKYEFKFVGYITWKPVEKEDI